MLNLVIIRPIFIRIASAFVGAFFCIRATDTLSSALFDVSNIKYCRTDNKHYCGDCYIIHKTHSYALRAYSALNRL